MGGSLLSIVWTKFHDKRLNVFLFVGFSLSQLQGGESQMLPGEHLITSYDANGRVVTEIPVARVGPTLFVAIGERKEKGGFLIKLYFYINNIN